MTMLSPVITPSVPPGILRAGRSRRRLSIATGLVVLAGLVGPLTSVAAATPTLTGPAGTVAAAVPAPGGSAWSIAPTVDLPVANGDLSATSCSAPGNCVAVGNYVDRHGRVATLAETWTDGRQRILATPTVPGAASSDLDGVSCTSSSACTAVGSTTTPTGAQTALAEMWDGTRWTVEATPDVGAGAALNAVSCPSATTCIAVGSAGDPTMTMTLAETWTGGAWTVLPTPTPATSGDLEGVSCTAPNACTAVGTATDTAFRNAALAERWDGSTWTIQVTPKHAHGEALLGVSCPSAVACTAVGRSDDVRGHEMPLAERWDGSTWSTEAVVDPTGRYNQFESVSCSSSTACAAVGSSSDGGESSTLAEGWNGVAWAVQTTPEPTDTVGPALQAVSCTGPGTCTSVGFGFIQGSDDAVTVVETFALGAWSAQAPRGASGTLSSSLDDVSCHSIDACTAVGSGTGPDGATTLAESWNGATWSVERTPAVAGATSSLLAGVSCAAADLCVAVGSWSDPSGSTYPLVERWNGRRWRQDTLPETGSGLLAGISCSSTSVCTVVGATTGPTGRQITLAERSSGTTWTVQPTVDPASGDIDVLSGVSCPTATACTAVGSSTERGGDRTTLAESWDGTSWTLESAPVPTGGTFGLLAGVSCVSAADCTAVGSYADGAGEVTLAEAWNGTTWTLQATPDPTGARLDFLEAVSCVSADACTAVGQSGDDPATLAEKWDGTTWSLDPTPDPTASPSYPGSDLLGVSCSKSSWCTTVGSYTNTSGTELTLGLREGPVADVTVTVSGPGTVADGSSFTEKVVVGDDGPSSAIGLATNVAIPAGAVTVTSAPGAVRRSGTLVWRRPVLAAGTTVTYQVVFAVDASATGIVDIGATAKSAATDPHPADNLSVVQVQLG